MDQNFKPDYIKDKNISQELQPDTLDIISVDGRWGQVLDSHSGVESSNTIVWLDGKNPTSGFIDLKEYVLTEVLRKTVGSVREQFTEGEISRIHWGIDQSDNQKLKLLVKVFGKYTKKIN